MSCAVLQGKEPVMPDAVGDTKIIKGVTATTGPGSKTDILSSQRPLVVMPGASASCYGSEKRDKLEKGQYSGHRGT